MDCLFPIVSAFVLKQSTIVGKVWSIGFFPFIFKKIWKKTHNIISLMLDPRRLHSIFICWKGTRCCCSWIWEEIFITYVREIPWIFASFDKVLNGCCRSRYFLLRLKFGYLKINCKYKWINERACPKGTIDFLTIPSGRERHQMSYSMVGVEKHESMFPIVSFLAC